MTTEEFRKHAHSLVDWMTNYLENVEDYPVLSSVKPGEIKAQFPKTYSEQSEDFSKIFKDFEDKIMPGITHWESPNFFAYFPASKSKASVLGEMLMSV